METVCIATCSVRPVTSKRLPKTLVLFEIDKFLLGIFMFVKTGFEIISVQFIFQPVKISSFELGWSNEMAYVLWLHWNILFNSKTTCLYNINHSIHLTCSIFTELQSVPQFCVFIPAEVVRIRPLKLLCSSKILFFLPLNSPASKKQTCRTFVTEMLSKTQVTVVTTVHFHFQK